MRATGGAGEVVERSSMGSGGRFGGEDIESKIVVGWLHLNDCLWTDELGQYTPGEAKVAGELESVWTCHSRALSVSGTAASPYFLATAG